MKKHFITILAAALAIAGCTKVSPGAPNTDEPDLPIKFQAANYVSSTKAGNNSEFTEKSFKVQAYYTGATTWAETTLSNVVNYMNGVEVKKSNNVWAPSDKDYFWPKTGYLTFIGWAPATVNATFDTSSNKMQIGFGDGTTDLLVTDIVEDKTANEHIYNHDGVPMLFHHILSKVSFKAKAKSGMNGDGITHHIVITSLDLKNITIDGTYTLNLITSSSNKASWGTSGGENDKSIFSLSNYSSLAIGATFSSVTGEISDTASSLLGSEFFAIPQTFSANAKVSIKYVIYYCNSAGKILDKHDKTAEAEEFILNSFTSSGSQITSWVQNKTYTYTIVIDPNSDQKITFDPVVENWENNTVDDKEN